MPALLPLRDEWFETHPRPASRATYERHLRTFLDYCAARGVQDTADLTNDLLLKYPPTLLDGYAGATVSLKITALKDYLGFLEDRDLVSIKWTRLERLWRRMPRADRHQVQLDDTGIDHMIDYCLTAIPASSSWTWCRSARGIRRHRRSRRVHLMLTRSRSSRNPR